MPPGNSPGTQMITTAGVPLHAFMVKQTRIKDVTMFAQIAKSGPYATPTDIPFSVLLPAFVTSELKTAFQIGFLIFLPFIVIDLVVATVLMSLGMAMLSRRRSSRCRSSCCCSCWSTAGR